MNIIESLPPGSDRAVRKGCACPVMDNARGAGSGRVGEDGKPLYWINEECPLHATRDSNNANRPEVRR